MRVGRQLTSPPVKLFVDSNHSKHDPSPLPDQPSRIAACLDAIGKAGLDFEIVEPTAASEENLRRVHTPDYLAGLERLCARGGGFIDPDTPAGPDSFMVAKRAAGACVAAVDAALDDGARSFCLVRPPGHHASRDQAMGFCLINNVAVGAAHAVAKGASRVVVLDIDVHHGNGTQEIFWQDPNVLYVSLHQWPWFPWVTGGAEERGAGEGEGANLNIPLVAGAGDETYLEAFESKAVPAIREFRPEMILVSAGFDAHTEDALSQQRVTSAGFGAIGAKIAALSEESCQGRLMMSLEGGYNLQALSESVMATLRTM